MERPIYTNRIKSRFRCADCQMLESLCICALIPRIDTATRLTLIIHHREARKTTNTGILATRALTNSRVRIRGAKDGPDPYADLGTNEEANLFLFPSDDAIELNAEFAAEYSDRPVNLIVPDGTWSQAKKVLRRLPYSLGIMPVKLPPCGASEYRLRHVPPRHEGCLSTLEAIGKAMAILESPAIEEQLLHPFRVMVSRTLYSRGKIKADEVFHGLPETEPPVPLKRPTLT